ncbi:Telo-bind domain-containing protein [Mycena sanguinolenta]|uniref:Telo-bind domain-containing protein n=1 Tax=Mycena sanguinolenta TaxID=230812 RepID=A0A8H7D9M5_9AGAR|nr:Telo-bind domain-containing protein [Mycena sanguinolenta]
MKRVAEDIDRDSKRPRHENHGGDSTAIFRDQIHEKTASNLLSWTPGESGYVCGKICMKWPVIKGKYRLKMEIFSLVDGHKQFEVTFHGICGEEFRRRGLEFKMGQELKLSLNGAVAEKASSQGINLPVSLKYTEGVALVIVPKGQEPELKIDTWFQAPATHEPAEPSEALPSTNDDWFSTPRAPVPPVRAPAASNLMDIDEEPAVAVASPPAAAAVSPPVAAAVSQPAVRKPVSKPSAPPKPTNPLTNIRNSLPIATPSRPMSSHDSPRSSSAPSRPARVVSPATVHPPGSSTPKENPPYPGSLNESVSVSLPQVNRAPALNANQASSSKLLERTSAPTVETVQPADAIPPSESVTPVNPTSAEPEKVLNKKQRKNLTRREKRKQQQQQKAVKPLPDVPAVHPGAPRVAAPPPATLAVHTEAAIPARTSAVHPEAATPARAVSPVTAHSQPSPSVPDPAPPSPSSSRPPVPHNFTAIAQLEAPNGRWNVYSIIGIVTFSTTPSTTRKGDWSCSLRVVDPSNCDESYRPAKEGILVNLFRKNHKEWLPAANAGDVILLQDIKTTNNYGAVGVNGYSDKFKWAVYDRTKQEITHGSLGTAPESETLADGFGRLFTPFYHATDADLTYCVALDEWWQGVEAKRLAALGTIHQVEAETSFISPRTTRKHKLIEETRIDEYFDCTVRVLHGHPNGQTHRIYVTDGTPLQGAQPCRISEVPLSLIDFVMPIEMWDDARLEGPNILSNEYYLLKNVRLKQSRDGYAEGKLVEAKIYKLERDSVDQNPNLKALVERLQPYDKDMDVEPEVELKLIKDAKDRQFMSCVVELLHIDEHQHALYVTDYTAHPKLPAIKESWAAGLDGHVLKLALFNEQRAIIQQLSVGQLYTILQLRLQASSTAQEFRGTLGGSERFIIPVNPKSSVAGAWKEDLLQRKNKLKFPTESRMEIGSTVTPRRAAVSPPRDHRNFHSIKQVLETIECPRTFRVRARVVDFFPFKLNDSFKRTCTKCNKLISSHRLACFECSDLEKKYVKIISIFCLFIDDGEQQLQLSVSGNIPLLKGIEPTILLDDPEAARQFAQRMKPLLNNLEAVHDGMLTNETIEPEGSEMTLMLDSWQGADKKIKFGLRDHEA